VVVVYKIDRLTRSLIDFSKIVEVFDQNGVSFVSVTQQFNTTTSMGRLTLNVLLSFAQFEREVTAERIRDKIAASKKKGMWMGGIVPLGYRVESRKLLVDVAEAETVRSLFNRYLELGSVRALVEDSATRGLSGRASTRVKDGSTVLPKPFGRGNLYHLLSNPIYVGKIRHGEKLYDGEHQGIIDTDTFDRVQSLLKQQTPVRRNAANGNDVHLLTGILFDETGTKLRATHANKMGVRYRYYVSKALIEERRTTSDGWRLPARELDTIVETQLIRILENRSRLMDWVQELAPDPDLAAVGARADECIGRFREADAQIRRTIIRSVFPRIVLQPGELTLHVDQNAVVSTIATNDIPAREGSRASFLTITIPISMRRRGVEMRFVMDDGQARPPAPDKNLIDLMLRAQRYLARLTDGNEASLSSVAKAEGVPLSEVSRILPLAFLSPRLVEQIIAGRQPIQLTAKRLLRLRNLPASWLRQEQLLA